MSSVKRERGVRSRVSKTTGMVVYGVSYDLPRKPDGSRHRTTEWGLDTLREANARAREIRTGLADGTHVHVARKERRTVGQYAEVWLAGISVRPNTHLDYRNSLAKAITAPRVGIGGVLLDDLRAEHLNALYRHLEKAGGRRGQPLKPKSVKHVHTAIRLMLADAVKAGYAKRNVAEFAKPPKTKETRSKVARERAWAPAQIEAFLAAAEGDHLYAVFHLLATTGLRRGEALALRWRDLNTDAATLRVLDAKTEAGERTIGLGPRALAGLRAWEGRQRELLMAIGGAEAWARRDVVFTDEAGEAIKPDRVCRRMRSLAAEAGLPHLSPHGLRHSYATAALRAGEPIQVVSQRLGHADPAITLSIYAHVLQGDDHATAARTEAAIFGG